MEHFHIEQIPRWVYWFRFAIHQLPAVMCLVALLAVVTFPLAQRLKDRAKSC
jgi:hypothetical protein